MASVRSYFICSPSSGTIALVARVCRLNALRYEYARDQTAPVNYYLSADTYLVPILPSTAHRLIIVQNDLCGPTRIYTDSLSSNLPTRLGHDRPMLSVNDCSLLDLRVWATSGTRPLSECLQCSRRAVFHDI